MSKSQIRPSRKSSPRIEKRLERVNFQWLQNPFVIAMSISLCRRKVLTPKLLIEGILKNKSTIKPELKNEMYLFIILQCFQHIENAGNWSFGEMAWNSIQPQTDGMFIEEQKEYRKPSNYSQEFNQRVCSFNIWDLCLISCLCYRIDLSSLHIQFFSLNFSHKRL